MPKKVIAEGDIKSRILRNPSISLSPEQSHAINQRHRALRINQLRLEDEARRFDSSSEKRQIIAAAGKMLWGKKWDKAQLAAKKGAAKRFTHIKNPKNFTDPVHDLPPIFNESGGSRTLNPGAIDHRFLWVQTAYFPEASKIEIEDVKDGIHFFGRVFYNDDPLLQFSSSVVITFALDHNRLEKSGTNRYNSEPIIDLRGDIKGWTDIQVFPVLMDDKWCKCKLHLKQTAYQLDFGGNRGVLAEISEVRNLIDEEGNGKVVTAVLLGNLKMPAVQIMPLPNLDIFVDLEIRFEIGLEGASFIAFSPAQNSAGSLRLQVPQWEPIAL